MSDDTNYPDLASDAVGGAVVWANDEFFASKDNLVKVSEPVWKEGKYTDRGKWMDGWETRRRREPGHDRCVVRLGLPGILQQVDVDTSHFDGNQPEYCTIEACHVDGDPDPEELAENDEIWTEILGESPLDGDSHNVFGIDGDQTFTHLRFHIYPDGGVARLRAYGEAMPELDRLSRVGEYDVAGVENGGRIVDFNDEHFGKASNLLLPTRPQNMGEGWETRRRRDDGHDWVAVRLGAASEIRRVVVDTEHFKGNYPAACALEGVRVPDGEGRPPQDANWKILLEKSKLRAHTRNTFEDSLHDGGPYTHVRLRIYPDGGVARLRIYGQFSESGWLDRRLRELNALPTRQAHEKLLACCGSRNWTDAMVENRPFGELDELLDTAERVWHELETDDWLEAFAAHPRIGEDADEGDQTEEGEAFSEEEQAGAEEIGDATERRLRELNEQYYDKFGFIFIVFATGKSAEEMLEILEKRLENDRETEIENAASEQLEITKLRLRKLVS